MMDKSKNPQYKVRWRHDPKWFGGVLDLSIIQGPFSVTKCQTLISRFATFSSLYGTQFGVGCQCVQYLPHNLYGVASAFRWWL
jgi:hypothetical protein